MRTINRFEATESHISGDNTLTIPIQPIAPKTPRSDYEGVILGLQHKVNLQKDEIALLQKHLIQAEAERDTYKAKADERNTNAYEQSEDYATLSESLRMVSAENVALAQDNGRLKAQNTRLEIDLENAKYEIKRQDEILTEQAKDEAGIAWLMQKYISAQQKVMEG